MTDVPIYESRQDRYGKTEKKTFTLTREAIAAIEAYANRQGLYFSVAIESLALMGLEQTTAEALPRMVANLLERTLNRQFNRFAKLISLAGLSAEAANYKVDVLLLQTIWREARLDPDNFLENMQVSMDPQAQTAARVRLVRDDLCADAHRAAEELLKRSWNGRRLFEEGDDA